MCLHLIFDGLFQLNNSIYMPKLHAILVLVAEKMKVSGTLSPQYICRRRITTYLLPTAVF